MKAVTLVKHGGADKAFQIKEHAMPVLLSNHVLIKVEAFGLNFADVMARRGLYKDAPPLPSILGYEVVGTVQEVENSAHSKWKNKRVVAFTRFGGYAEFVAADIRAIAEIPDTMDVGTAAALATQYSTAYFASHEMINLHEGDHVLIQAAAGGVGTAIVQLAKRKKCIIYGTAGSPEKIKYLKELGVDHAINYNEKDFYTEIKKLRGAQGIDVAFDAIGGEVFSKSRKLLGAGGRMVGYGAADLVGGNIIGALKFVLKFGIIHPISLLNNSRGVIGVNMLRIADSKPEVLQRCLTNVVALAINGEVKPHVGAVFNINDIGKAHDYLEKRKSMGKIVVTW